MAQDSFLIGKGETIVFFGDSITEEAQGYVEIVRCMIEGQYPDRQISVVNAGIGGHKVTSLEARLESDVLSRRPDWVVTMIGVNDVWHGADGVPLEQYQACLDSLVSRMDQAGIRQILMTPTVIGEDLENDENRKLKGYVEALTEVGRKHGIPVIPLRQYFESAISKSPESKSGSLLTRDGVHPNPTGHFLISIALLQELHYDFSLGNLA